MALPLTDLITQRKFAFLRCALRALGLGAGYQVPAECGVRFQMSVELFT